MLRRILSPRILSPLASVTKKELRRATLTSSASDDDMPEGLTITIDKEEDYSGTFVTLENAPADECAKYEKCIKLPEEDYYKEMDKEFNESPLIGRAYDGLLRNLIRLTSESWARRFGALPCLRGKNLSWVQLLLLDQEKAAQLKLYALGSRVAMNKDDSDVVERSRKLFKDAAPTFMKDYDLWIFSRSLVRKGYNGVIDPAAHDFSSFDPLGSLLKFPMDPSSGGRCAEIFLFFAVDGDVPGDDLSSRDAVMTFLEGLNSEEGARKLHAFTVVSGSVVAKWDKLSVAKGVHIAA